MREQVDNCQRCLIQTGCNNPPHMWKNILLFSAKVRSAPSQWGTVQAQLSSDILDLQNLISHKGWQNFFFFTTAVVKWRKELKSFFLILVSCIICIYSSFEFDFSGALNVYNQMLVSSTPCIRWRRKGTTAWTFIKYIGCGAGSHPV